MTSRKNQTIYTTVTGQSMNTNTQVNWRQLIPFETLGQQVAHVCGLWPFMRTIERLQNHSNKSQITSLYTHKNSQHCEYLLRSTYVQCKTQNAWLE